MRDMAENMVVLDCIRAASSSGEANARANGVMATAGYIDLEDYNFPRKMLICSSVGTVGSSGTLNIDIEHGTTTGALVTDTGTTFTAVTAVGDAVTEYTPTRRYINIEGTVTNSAVVYSITLIMDHSRSGAQSGLVT